MSTKGSLYHQIIDITADYLGPAAKRFVDRQITSHLEKDPEKLTARDLPKLTLWMEAVIPLLTKDEETVEEYIAKLENLSAGKTRGVSRQ